MSICNPIAFILVNPSNFFKKKLRFSYDVQKTILLTYYFSFRSHVYLKEPYHTNLVKS